MKLKKVVSLALAGVLAVSMLAGCATGKKPGTGEGEGEGATTGYSAEFADIADLKMDNVSFKDSTVDQAALKKAVDSCTDVQLLAALVNGNFDNNGNNGSAGRLQGAMVIPAFLNLNCTSVFAEEAELTWYNEGLDFGGNVNINDTQKLGVIVAVDGTMDTVSVLKQANKLVADGLKALEKGSTDQTDGISYDYSYSVSVSVVNRTTTTVDLVKADIDFVAVTVTRTSAPHKV